ncbi:MAG: radical SAM protein [Bdellovibrionales bacterium]|nr:radical SAM protein [Bdellovibrionales bacterium]
MENPKLSDAKLFTVKDFSSLWEERLYNYTYNPLPSNPNKPFTLVMPSTNQAPTLQREFLLYTPCEGVSYIGTVAQTMGYDVELIDLRMDGTLETAAQRVAERGGVLAMPTFVDSIPQNMELLELVRKKNKDVVIILGGALVSSLPEPICEALEVDFAILQEGEITLVELLEFLDSGGKKENSVHIMGLAIKMNDGRIVKTLPRPQIKTLDSVPIPNLFLYPSIKINPYIPEMGLTTARGCYGRCTFCFVNIPKMRFKSVKRVDEEIADLVKNYKTEYLYINDLTFTADIKRTWHICDVLAKHGLKWSCSTRVEKTDPALLKKMYESGCKEIWYGVESLDQDILNITQKNQTVDQINEAIDMTLDAGITVMANLIVGLPGETQASLEKMFQFVEKAPVIPASIKFLTPFPGTPIYEEAKRRGIVKNDIEYLISLADRQVNNVKDEIYNFTELTDQELREAFARLTEIKNRRFEQLRETDHDLKNKLYRTDPQKELLKKVRSS